MNYLDKIICGDCLKVIPKIPPRSVDLVLTSPPYNVNLGENKFKKKGYDIHDDNRVHDKYIAWLKRIFRAIYPKLKKGGRVVINVGDGKNGSVPTHSDIIQFMKELNYLQMSTIVWSKGNTSNRCAWGSFMSPQCPSFPTPFEYIMIFAKETNKLQNKGETDLKKEEFVDWSMALWDIPKHMYRESIRLINSGVHPAPFPEELPKRCIKMLTWKGSVVLDPFMGCGTTAIVCKKLDRHFIGIEISKEYCKRAETRLKNVIVTDNLFENIETEVTPDPKEPE